MTNTPSPGPAAAPPPAAARLPIFALGTVLFPEGVLPLRVFEARYVDMVRRVMRDGTTFGVSLIRRGIEVGDRGVDVERIGCRARIDDWNMEQLGVLEIVAVGTERFEIVSTRVEDDGLMTAEVSDVPEEPVAAFAEEDVICRELMRRVASDIESATPDAAGGRSPIARPYRFDDPAWVGNRLAEILPMTIGERQRLMALNDAGLRLAGVRAWLVENGVV